MMSDFKRCRGVEGKGCGLHQWYVFLKGLEGVEGVKGVWFVQVEVGFQRQAREGRGFQGVWVILQVIKGVWLVKYQATLAHTADMFTDPY